jgi:hypothetical protein
VANLSLVFDVLAKDNASPTFKKVGDSAEQAGKQTSGFGSTMASGMKLAAGALLGAGLIEGFKSLYEAADESRKIAALTTQVIKSTGGAAGVSAKQVGDLAAAIAKKTGIDDEAIQSGQNLLLTFTNIKNQAGAGNDIFNQTTKIMTDMSVALGTDASGSAIQLGKALNDPIKGVSALQRVGVSFTASQKEQIKTLVESGDVLGAQKVILSELGKEFGGAAEAAATPLGKLTQRAGDLAEKIGGYLVPIVDKLATFFGDKVLPALSGVGDVVAGVLIPAFKVVSTVVGAAFDAFNSLPGPLKLALEIFGAYLALRGPLTSLFNTVADGATSMAFKMASSVGAAGGFKGAVSGLIGSVSPMTLAIGAATTAVAVIGAAMQNSTQKTKDWADALGKGGAAARQATEDMQKAPDAWDRFGFALTHSGNSMGAVGKQAAEARQALEDYRSGLDPVAEAQSRVTEWTNTLSDRLTDGKVVTEDARTGQERLAYWSDVLAGRQSALKDAVAGATSTSQTFEQQTKDTRDALDEAKNATDNFKLSLDILSGANVSSIELESRFQAALAEADGAMKDLSGSVLNATGDLNLQSEAGRKAADVLLDVRNSGNDLIATMIQQGATSDEVQAKDAQLRQSFINTAGQMGITGQNAENLANKILGIPGERKTTITADTSQANGAIDNLVRKIESAGGTHVVTVSGPAAGPGGTQTKAQGGYISGPGSGTSDSIPARLSNGEFVVKASETAKHLSLLHAMNAGMLPAFADGGPVLAGQYTIPVGLTQSTLAALEKKLTPVFTGGGVSGGNAANRALGQQIAAAMGLAGQFSAIDYVFTHESGWNNLAQNPTSTAYGIAQFLNSTWATVGGHKTSDPGLQIQYGLKYMNKYGGPNGAAAFWQAHHWYEDGTNYVPSNQLAVLHQGEAVIPASQNQGAPYQGGGEATFHIYDTDGVLMGTMRGHAEEVVVGALSGVANRRRYNS